ncbi:hypothetical protein PhaeoP66_03249 [Phaeobacter inhibens]|uniref:Uncharacterized protein n=1 Tax=Phaeobacter inhibens TaxID=221822 RepID=A0ABM6RI81_9RHOB|nr:hypothetical protein [Phaeobacter inhibens]AUQ95991.1 hypothetical protein PhaeoP66_03249 [Phaeobacter inhibens]
MTMSINVTIPEDDIKAGAAPQYLARAMSAIGFTRGVTLPMPDEDLPGEECNQPAFVDSVDNEDIKSDTVEDVSVDVSPRPFGQADEGKTRRNKDQMAEDKEIEALWPRDKDYIPTNVPATQLLADLKAGKISAETPNISTGDERIDPTGAEDKAQDAADEAAEVDANKSDVLTLDDLRQAAGNFQKLHGMAAAMEIIPELLGCGLHDVPEDQIGAAIEKLNAYKETPEKTEDAPFTATKDDVIAEMLNYAGKYDGERADQSKMVVLNQDRPKIFVAAMGPDITGLSMLPDDPAAYGRVVLALREAIEKNPFDREVKG